MRLQRFLSRSLGLALPLALVAGCNGDSTGPDRLTPEEVGGDYQICTLAFEPIGDLPPGIDIAGAVDLTGLELSTTSRDFSLLYRPEGGTTQTLSGSYTPLAGDEIRLTFDDRSEATEELLLPGQLTLAFLTGPQRLSVADSTAYNVPKSSYERLQGQEYPNLVSQIEGTLTAEFRVGSCEA